jgi:hypothetical protein
VLRTHAKYSYQRIQRHPQIADVIDPPMQRILVRAEKLIATLALAAKVTAVRGRADIVQTKLERRE